MDAERYARIRELFEGAMAHPESARESFLASSCDDESIRAEVRSLLAGQLVKTESLRPPVPDLAADPERLGAYRIERRLGEGGMGVVYLADCGTGPVALKVLHPWLQISTTALERFRREATAGIAVRNEHVVRTLEADSAVVEDGSVRHFLVMEYVEGRTLRDLQAQLGRVPETLLREIALQAARGLAAVHAAGLLHRDLKPENILLSNRQQVRIMDLGISKLLEGGADLTAEGQFIGSLAYAAPEQFGEFELGPAADQYALGVLLYELASGTNPFRGDGPAEIIRAHLDREPAPLVTAESPVSRFFSDVIDTMLRKDPTRRFASATELAIVLEEGERSPWWRNRARRVPGASIPVPRDAALCGRAGELATLRSAWSAASRGSGSVVLLTGAEGMGKSRLLAEWLDGVDATGANVLYGSFAPGGRTVGLVQALRDHLRDREVDPFLQRYLAAAPQRAALADWIIPGRADEQAGGNRTAAFAGLMHGLAAERPVLWIVDDVQFAGEEAQRILPAMARATRDRRALLVLAGSEDSLQAMAGSIGEAARTQRIELRGLHTDGVVALLEQMVGGRALAERIAPRVAELSDGVPLVIHEVMRGMWEQGILDRDADGFAELRRPLEELALPPALRDLVARRVGRLEPAARRVLDAAAIEGTSFDAAIVAEVLEQPLLQVLQELAEIERKHGFVRSAGERHRFEHHLVAEAMRDELPPALRAELHALTADALGRRTADSEAVVRIVQHHLEGSRPEQALPHLDAALAALDTRRESHAALAARALAIDGLLTGVRRVDVLLLLAHDCDVMVRREEQQRLCEEAYELAKSERDERRTAQALLSLSGAHFGQGRPERALELGVQLIELAGKLDDRSMEIRALLNRGTSLGRLGRREEARRVFAAACTIAHAEGDDRLEAAIRLNDGLQAKELGATKEAEQQLLESLRIAERSGDRRIRSYAHANLGLLWSEVGRFDDAIVHLDAQLSLARETGDARAESIAMGNLGLVALNLGRLGVARERFEHHLELARLVGERRGIVIAHVNLGEVNRLLGRPEQAMEHYRLAQELTGEGSKPGLGGRLFALRSELMWQQQEFAEAKELAREAVKTGEESGDQYTIWHGNLTLGSALLELGERDEARRAFSVARTIARAFGLATLLLPTEVALALLDGDVAAAERSLAQNQERAPLVQRLEVHFDLWKASGDRAHLDSARALLDTLRREAPGDVTPAEFARVPLYRAIDG